MSSDTEKTERQGWRKLVPWGSSSDEDQELPGGPGRWSMGILNDKTTVEVPGSVLLLASDHNQPLGLRITPARTSHSSLPTSLPPYEPVQAPPPPPVDADKKKTPDGRIILEPQPEDSANDPLNWSAWRRDAALLSLGLFSMLGGGMTPVLAAGFTNVAQDYDMDVARVSLTTGLYMMGLAIGSVFFSPTAILFGKRPVYLFGAVIFVVSSVWCALSPNFVSLILARIFQGIAVSPVECLPSATIAEIFFLHERAFRIGIYTLLLLGGKNLVPLVSAAVIQRLGWRWVFWIVAMVVGLCGVLLFLFVPETFWDRTPVSKVRRHSQSGRPGLFRRFSSMSAVPQSPHSVGAGVQPLSHVPAEVGAEAETHQKPETNVHRSPRPHVHIGFAPDVESPNENDEMSPTSLEAAHIGSSDGIPAETTQRVQVPEPEKGESVMEKEDASTSPPRVDSTLSQQSAEQGKVSSPGLPSPTHLPENDHSTTHLPAYREDTKTDQQRHDAAMDIDSERQSVSRLFSPLRKSHYTNALRDKPAQSVVQQLKIYNGRLNHDKWLKVAVRPFILYSYPSVLWSAAVYSCSIGWLIVISESVAVIYRDTATYNFTALQTGLVYISPFVGGVLGTAVAGRVSDVVVKAMARRNGGLYEPEFRLVMALPVAITTVIGLMGFGWSAQVRDNWIVPTVFFGLISFGCSLGSTTSITFCVDSYRQYAGEALVTLNFAKNICHGLVFSLFVTEWIGADGPRTVFLWIGIIQLIVLVFTVPMYIYGKRARMWTVRKNLMEKF